MEISRLILVPPLQAMLKRALLMKDAIKTLQDQEEWDSKVPVKFREKDFDLMAKVVLVLEVEAHRI